MISPESGCLAPGAFRAFALSEALLYGTEVPHCERYTLYQFQGWIGRQNKTETDGREENKDRGDVPDSPAGSAPSRQLSCKDPAFLDSAEVSS